MAFDIGNITGRDAGLLVGGLQHLFLGAGVRGHQAVGTAVLIHRAAQYNSIHPVAIGQRLGERLENDHAHPFAAHVAISPGIKGFAAAVGGHGPGFTKIDGHGR